MGDVSEQVKLLVDRVEIGDLLTRYSVALDTQDWGQLATVFTPDATIDYTSSGGIRGQFPEVAAWLKKSLTPFRATQHMLGNSQIALSGDRGTGRTYFFNPNALADESGKDTLIFVGGFYLDTFVRTEVGWRIEDRYESSSWVQSDVPIEEIVQQLQGG